MTHIVNKNAKREYEILKTYVAGLALLGSEVKSLRLNQSSLKGSHVKIIDGEAFLLNAQINPYAFSDNREYDPKRSRKLLLKKKEINQLAEASKRKNITLVPLRIFAHGRTIKLELGVGRGKKQYEKRADLKRKAVERDVRRELKTKARLR